MAVEINGVRVNSALPAAVTSTRRTRMETGYLTSNVKTTNARAERRRKDSALPAAVTFTGRTRMETGYLSSNVKTIDARTGSRMLESAILAKKVARSSSRRMRMGYGQIYTEPQSNLIELWKTNTTKLIQNSFAIEPKALGTRHSMFQ